MQKYYRWSVWRVGGETYYEYAMARADIAYPYTNGVLVKTFDTMKEADDWLTKKNKEIKNKLAKNK